MASTLNRTESSMKKICAIALLLYCCAQLLAEEASPKLCAVVAYRPWMSIGGSIRLGVLVDHRKVFNLKGGNHEQQFLSCGKHFISLAKFEGIQVPVNFTFDSVTYIRAERPWGLVSTANVRVVDKDQAEAEIEVASAKK